MPLVNLVVVLIIVGIALYLQSAPIHSHGFEHQTILNVVVVAGVCVWVLQAVGLSQTNVCH